MGGGAPVDFGDWVGVVAQGGRSASAVAEAGGGVPEVEAAGEELAGGVWRPPLMSSSTPAASAASATRCVTQSGFHGRACAGSLENRYASSRHRPPRGRP